jgi:RNA recognition motif-containing protein
VFVGNLSFDVTRDELVQAFSAAGKVVDAKLPVDRETGRPRGFAFVEFETEDAARSCIATMNGKDLKGRALRVNEAENRPPRPPGSGPPFRPSGGGYRGPGGPPYGAARSGPPPEGFPLGEPPRGFGRGPRRPKKEWDKPGDKSGRRPEPKRRSGRPKISDDDY